MTKQENNHEYFPVVNMGFHRIYLKDISTENLLEKVHKYKKENPVSNARSNRGGYQSEDNINFHPDFFNLTHDLNNVFYGVFNTPQQRIISMWINISSYKHSNYIHTHGNDHDFISGVLYLQVPEHSGEIGFINPITHNIEVLFLPSPKDLLLFPQNLPHLVNPNLSQEDRISIAFNYG